MHPSDWNFQFGRPWKQYNFKRNFSNKPNFDLVLANDEVVEKFKEPTKLELTCHGDPLSGYDAMVISMSGGLFSYQ